jgi:hypothetical protein
MHYHNQTSQSQITHVMNDFYCIYILSTLTAQSEIQQEESTNNTDINYIKFTLFDTVKITITTCRLTEMLLLILLLVPVILHNSPVCQLPQSSVTCRYESHTVKILQIHNKLSEDTSNFTI